jgi:hypothetical protein
MIERFATTYHDDGPAVVVTQHASHPVENRQRHLRSVRCAGPYYLARCALTPAGTEPVFDLFERIVAWISAAVSPQPDAGFDTVQ